MKNIIRFFWVPTALIALLVAFFVASEAIIPKGSQLDTIVFNLAPFFGIGVCFIIAHVTVRHWQKIW